MYEKEIDEIGRISLRDLFSENTVLDIKCLLRNYVQYCTRACSVVCIQPIATIARTKEASFEIVANVLTIMGMPAALIDI